MAWRSSQKSRRERPGDAEGDGDDGVRQHRVFEGIAPIGEAEQEAERRIGQRRRRDRQPADGPGAAGEGGREEPPPGRDERGGFIAARRRRA
jgi:hypothetical protein